MSRQSDSRLAIASVAGTIQTVGQGRAALGLAAQYLKEAFEKLDSVPASIFDEYDVRNAVKSLLNSTNNYAQRVYAEINYEGPSIEIQLLEIKQATQIAAALEFSRKGIVDVEDAANEDYWDFVGALTEVIRAAGEVVATTLKSITNQIAAVSTGLFLGFWPWLVAAMIIIIIAWKSGVLTSV